MQTFTHLSPFVTNSLWVYWTWVSEFHYISHQDQQTVRGSQYLICQRVFPSHTITNREWVAFFSFISGNIHNAWSKDVSSTILTLYQMVSSQTHPTTDCKLHYIYSLPGNLIGSYPMFDRLWVTVHIYLQTNSLHSVIRRGWWVRLQFICMFDSYISSVINRQWVILHSYIGLMYVILSQEQHVCNTSLHLSVNKLISSNN